MRVSLLVVIMIFAQQSLSARYAQSGGEDVVWQPTEEESETRLVAPADLGSTRTYLNENIQVRTFDKAEWEKIVGDADYTETAPEPEPDSAPLSLPWAGPLLKGISYVIIIALVVWLLYYLARNITFGSRIERTKLQGEDLASAVDDIEELDIDELLDKARGEGDFKMAVRLYYLRLLKKLNAMGIIAWKKDKTNRDYLSELFSKGYHYSEMQALTIAYEGVWYGEHAIHGESFQRLTQQFEVMYQRIDLKEGL
jgi:hypothetical protein